eukprot:gnl/TRDRNA2_/TRDRNA2_176962_c1_seq3.p2 gnl/TRDRNA2_/TRDRNA2_176962_c1~~gnl/TRDRNA2_/TRDRNA2_176962_c1_seq3.p2  ORF type:complete len:115 (+),score=23.46 gnl/TRDRNA2_/TRDRNA2_176962_c1_seq3:267-611(+)
MSASFQLYLKMHKQSTPRPLTVTELQTIGEIKALVGNLMERNPDIIALSCAGIPLEDHHRTISQYGILDGSSLVVGDHYPVAELDEPDEELIDVDGGLSPESPFERGSCQHMIS